MYKPYLTIITALLLSGCVTAQQQYNNSPQAACSRLGLSGAGYQDCVVKMATSDREATNASRIVSCAQARQNANNSGGGFFGGFTASLNANGQCN